MGLCFITCVALISALALSSAEKIRYDGYHVISVKIENEQQREFVDQLVASTDDMKLLETAAVNRKAMILIAPNKFSEIADMFLVEGLEHQTETTNLQKLIDEEQPEVIPRQFGWTAYYRLGEIYAWIDEKIRQYPKLLTNYTVGTTYENRTIRAVRLSYKPGNPTIFIESTVHAREWITVATTTYFLNELLTSKNATIVYLAQNYDWVIVPVFNPDGYEYTHTTDREWRRNRQPSNIAYCRGVDVNRNFGVNFGGPGTSDNPCSDIYRGRSAFSERESSSLSRFIDRFSNTRLYISFHSFSQLLMYPYGYKKTQAPNYDDLERIGQKTAKAISRRYSTYYEVGPIATTIYLASGNTVDWAYESKNISLSYTFEFRPRSQVPGFILPANQIIPNSLEVIDGLVAMVAEAKALNYF